MDDVILVQLSTDSVSQARWEWLGPVVEYLVAEHIFCLYSEG